MLLFRWHAAVLALLAATAAREVHASSYLYAASSYNVFVRNNFSDFNSDVEGGVAAGGRISTTGGFSFASLNPGLPYSVVAAIDFTATGSGSVQGNLYDGTAGGINSTFTVNGSITSDGGNPANSPIDFSTAFTKLDSLSTSLGAMAATAGDSCTNYYGSINCTVGNSPGLHVIKIPAGSSPSSNGGAISSYDIGSNYGINISAANPNVTLILDIAGSSGTFTSGAGWNLSGISGTRILVNYYEATSLTLGTSGIEASLLAPFADVRKSSYGGYFDGNFIANSFNGSVPEEFHNQLFNGTLPEAPTPTPEPAAAVLAGAGLAVLLLRSSIIIKSGS